ncbi:unnamed protein product, partial [Iphiclides podalirius]
MKFFAVFAAVLALAAGAPWSWTLEELSSALQNPETNPEYLPYLEHALNQIMENIYAGNPVTPVAVVMPTTTTWTLEELSAALEDPTTNPALVPYLESALNEIMHALHSGQQISSIPVVIPVGLTPVQVEAPVGPAPAPVSPVIPTPVVPTPVIPTPVVPTPVLPVAPESPAAPAPSSPLVQIIVNIKQQQQIGSKPVLNEIEPTPVTVVEEAENIDVNPVDVIAIQPPQINPVDVIAVLPPQVNPIDAIAPLPVEMPMH